MVKTKCSGLAILVLCLCLGTGAGARASVIGSRTTPETNGIVASDGWEQPLGGFKISWDIEQVGADLWTYSYKLSNADGSMPTDPALSHFILEVSGDITDENWHTYFPDVTTGTVVEVEDFTATSDGNSNPYLPGTLHGIKFAGDNYIFEFTSTQAPVWGDFYAKDGKHLDPESTKEFATAWNAGITGDGPTLETTDFTPWIPRPDGDGLSPPATIVPEPGLSVLGLSALLAGAVARRKAKKKAEASA